MSEDFSDAKVAATQYIYLIDALEKNPSDPDLLKKAKSLRKTLKRFDRGLKALLNVGRDTDIFDALTDEDCEVDNEPDVDSNAFIDMMRDRTDEGLQSEG